MTRNLIERNDPILRAIAAEVPLKDIGSKKTQVVVNKMKKALHAEDDGVAIAAPQIGASLQIFIVKGSNSTTRQDRIFFNPKITKASRKKNKVEEGCLSLRYLYGQVLRHDKVSIEAYDESGKKLNVGASGLLAQIFQHEIDHLKGVLFVDKAEDLRDIPPEKHD